MKFSSAIYNVTEGMDPNVTIALVANGAVDESSFSVRVIAKDGTATSGYIRTCTGSVYVYIWAHKVDMRACTRYNNFQNLSLKWPFC